MCTGSGVLQQTGPAPEEIKKMSHDDRETYVYTGVASGRDGPPAREVSPVELTEACLRRIDELEPKLHAFLHLAPEYAMDAAREAGVRSDAGR